MKDKLYVSWSSGGGMGLGALHTTSPPTLDVGNVTEALWHAGACLLPAPRALDPGIEGHTGVTVTLGAVRDSEGELAFGAACTVD